jgi:protein-tyrosine-phosphatase
LKKQLVTEKKVLLLIDTGDNCRCPMAAGYFLKLLEQRGVKHIDIKTAGVMTPTGLLPTPEAVLLLHEEGVDIRRHRSRPLSAELIRRADLVLGMTPFHVQSAYRMAEDARGKTFLLKEYVGREGRNTQIADPMGGTLEIFKKCFAEIKASLQRLVEMEFVTKAPEAREMIVVDTTPKPLPSTEEVRKPKAARKAEESKPAKEKAKPAPVAKKKSMKPEKKAKKEKPAKKVSAPSSKAAKKSSRAAKPAAKKPKAVPAKKSQSKRAAASRTKASAKKR